MSVSRIAYSDELREGTDGQRPITVGTRIAAKILGISERTLLNYRRAGIIPAIEIHSGSSGRTGRVLFSITALEAWANARSSVSK